MEQGANTTYVRYNLIRGSGPITLSLKAIINARDYHDAVLDPIPSLHALSIDRGLQVHSGSDIPSFYLFTPAGKAQPVNTMDVSLFLATREGTWPP